MDREISFLRDIIYYILGWISMNEKMSQQLFLTIVLDIFLFFFLLFKIQAILRISRYNSAKQGLRENRFPNSGGGRNISRSDLFFKKINLIARFLDF